MDKSELENLKDIQDWAALYDDFYVFKNNEHNIHFWQVTKVKNFKEAEKLLKRNFNWKDISGGMKYIDWWDKDCKNAVMSGNKPVDWMKERLMKDKLALEYFGNKKLYTQKESNINDLKVTKETDFIETREKKEKPAFSKNKKSKDKSPFPPWLLFITIPLILGLPSYISSFRSQPTEIQSSETKSSETKSSETKSSKTKSSENEPNKYICEICRTMNTCALIPQCITKQEKCVWKQNWDGTVEKECKSY